MPEEKTAAELEAEANATGEDTITSETGEATETTETIENNEEQIEINEEDKKKLEAEQSAAKTQKEKDKIQKRIDTLVSQKKALEQRNKDLEKKLAERPDADKVLTEDDVEKRSDLKANQKVAEREFNNSCNRLFNAATKINKDFKKTIDNVVEELGGVEIAGIPGDMIGILDDLDNGGEVLNYLATNSDDYEEIRGLSTAKMGIKLGRLSDKLEADKKKPKAVSQAPNPLTPIGGSRASPSILTGKESMDDFVKIRTKQLAEKEERRKQGLRG